MLEKKKIMLSQLSNFGERAARRSMIVLTLTYLHLKFYRFKPNMILQLESGVHRSVFTLFECEYAFAVCWNHRLSRALTRLTTQYARCMKRALVMSLMLGSKEDLWFLIGVDKDLPTQGHAWLELDGSVMFENFSKTNQPFIEVRRLPVSVNGQ